MSYRVSDLGAMGGRRCRGEERFGQASPGWEREPRSVGASLTPLLLLASDAIAISVEAMGVTSLGRKEPRADVAAVEIRRRRQDAGVGIGGVALAGS